MQDLNLSITDIFAILSSAIVVIGGLAALFRKIRTNIATNMASLINVDDLSKNSSLYKTLEINNKILEQLNDINTKSINSFGKINDEFKNINRTLLRLEIISAMDHRSENEPNIYKLYQTYKEMGGNSYVDKLMKDWEAGKYPSVDKVVEHKVAEHTSKNKKKTNNNDNA